MSAWKKLIDPKSSVWSGVTQYAAERIAELTGTCVSPEATEADIRRAQAGIAELKRLCDVPSVIQVTATTAGQRSKRTGY